MNRTDDADALSARLEAGDRAALARAITLSESSRPEHRALFEALMERAAPPLRPAYRLGVSGVPGVGKSTLIEALGLYLVDRGHRVAVLAVDPTSAVSGGSLLGDKTRMPGLSSSLHAFVRPSPARGKSGGIGDATGDAVVLCESAGYDVVVVETVGVGQSEHAVRDRVDTFVLLMLAGAGDELQGIKRGVLELADLLAINKADGDNKKAAERAASELSGALKLLRPAAPGGWSPTVLTLSALERRGVGELWHMVERHRQWLESTQAFDEQRRAQRRARFRELCEQGVLERFYARAGVASLLAELDCKVQAGEITPAGAARLLLGGKSDF